MPADVKRIDTWSSYCNECRWTAIFFSEAAADDAADGHDDTYHPETGE